MTYSRRPGQSAVDQAAAREFEETVRNYLPDYVFVRTESSTELDFMVPSITVEVKEKRQPLTKRWWREGSTSDSFQFVIDELTVRKALKHYPYVWFVMRDLPQGNIYLASISELLSLDRHRFNRNGKGKWVVDTYPLRIIDLGDLMTHIKRDLEEQEWKASCCVVSAPEV